LNIALQLYRNFPLHTGQVSRWKPLTDTNTDDEFNPLHTFMSRTGIVNCLNVRSDCVFYGFWLPLWHLQINVREYRSSNQKLTIQRNWQHDEEKQSQNTTQYVLDSTAQTNTNNVNETWALLQTTVGRDETNIVFMEKS
jgi:hypothetical protein